MGAPVRDKNVSNTKRRETPLHWTSYRGPKRHAYHLKAVCMQVVAFVKRRMGQQRSSKWVQQQLAYRWELYEGGGHGHGHGHGDSTATFDFLGGLPAWGIFRLLIFVGFLGVVIGSANTIFFYLEYVVQHKYDNLVDDIFPDSVVYTSLLWVVGATLSSGTIGYLTRVYVPECSGAGVDATKICMAVSAPIPIAVAFFRIIFSSVYTGLGNPLGIEAPTLHVSAALSSSMLRAASKVLPDDFRLEHLPTWVLVGKTTGLGTAFRAPLAGMMYAIEEYMNIRKLGLAVVLIGVASTVGVFVSTKIRDVMDSILDVQTRRNYVLRVDFATGYGSLLCFLIALLCALLSQIVAKITLNLRLINSTVFIKYIPLRFQGFVGGFVVGVIGMVVYGITGKKGIWGVGVEAYEDLLTLPMCTEEATGWGRLTLNSDSEAIFFLLPLERVNDSPQVYKIPTDTAHCQQFGQLLVFTIGKALAVCVAVSIGGPGGLFFPALLIGGKLGGVTGSLFQMLDPSNAIQYHMAVMLGMVGFFSALMRTPMTAILVAYEMSGYGALGLSIGLTYSMIMTSVLAHLLAESMDSTDLVSHMMLQDGIDAKELFKKGLVVFQEEGAKDDDEDENDATADDKFRSSGSKVFSRRGSASLGVVRSANEEPRREATIVLRHGRGAVGGASQGRRRSWRRSASNSNNDEIANMFLRRGSNTDSVGEDGGGGVPVANPKRSGLRRGSSMGFRDVKAAEQTEGAARDRIAEIETEIKQKKKEATVEGSAKPQQKSAANTILLGAAKRALVDQRHADHEWLHLLTKRSNVQGMHEHLKKVKRLDMNWVHPVTGETVLTLAIRNKLQNAVRLLLCKRCDPDFTPEKDGPPPILEACKYGLEEAASCLIANGANLEVSDGATGNMPLHLAAASGNGKLVRGLIEGNASLSQHNRSGESPMVIAAKYRWYNLISILGAESWRCQDGGDLEFMEKYVLKIDRTRRIDRAAKDKKRVPSPRPKADVNGSSASSSTRKASAKDNESTENVIRSHVVRFLSFDPTAEGFAWGDEYSRIKARTQEEFRRSISETEIDSRQFVEMPITLLWSLHISLCAMFFSTRGSLRRHASISEVRLVASIHGQRFVLMERSKDGGFRYMNMTVTVPEHNSWQESANVAVCHNLGVDVLWISDNCKFLEREEFIEEVNRAKLPQFQTSYHVNSVTYEILNPHGPACTEGIFIGLPSLEPFMRKGKIWNWISYDKSSSIFDWGIL